MDLRHFLFICGLFISVILEISCSSFSNPYQILGVDKRATLPELKRAYKQLAKEWHPDKSDHPDAEKKFIEIKQAYELLSDVERRKAYDGHGITNEDYLENMYARYREQKNKQMYNNFARYNPDSPINDYFPPKRNYEEVPDNTMYHKLSITTRYYETNVLPKSKHSPHLLIFYTDWCFSCLKISPAFKKVIEALESLGVVMASVNLAHENQLARKAGVSGVPNLVLVVDEHPYVYKGTITNVQMVVDFVRNKLPYKLVTPVDDEKCDEFLKGWHDNKVRALIFEPRQQPRLRYLLTAYFFNSRVHFGFVQTLNKESSKIIERYKVNPKLDTVLLFKEDSLRPVASISMSEIKSATLANIISSNQYLALPRLSSQGMMDGICPAEWHLPHKRLCVILVTENSVQHDYARQVLRRVAIESNHTAEQVKFAYIYKDKQKDFVRAISTNNKPDDALLKVVIIWRRDRKHLKYVWIEDLKLDESNDIGEDEDNFNKTKQKIDETIEKLIKSFESLSHEVEVKDLFDEHSQNLATRVIKRIIIGIDYMYDSLGNEHIFPAISAIGTVLFILGVGYLMTYLVKMEEENIRKLGYISTKKHQMEADKKTAMPELRIHEMRAEKYNGLVRLLKPGCRTIILITDTKSRPKLLPGYHKAIWPYRKNKTLLFGILAIERGVSWYSELLRLSMTESRDLIINPRNCIGTVLALNGHRKYFCVYHAKHPETSRGTKRMLQMAKRLSFEYGDPEAGAFLGLESDDSSDQATEAIDDSKILLEENLLDGLSNWLDRLFEGSTHRYFINYWPDFPTK
ncbi:CLUMA_CG020587, isoform A [Clunio marinus]|uniref:DnaJ homolog subfamily C member 16 n=1 Tax=Clunio marinus TaxID=568069 RepID=A0A1J1J813_9DIPT|nr:CLUMA_CG020587, isoform A [Clunio marinus]